MTDNELIIDNFAGGGGASVGIREALGRDVDVAINHDPVAIAMHRANHPRTLHLNENVWDVDPIEVCKGTPVGLAWFSPDCTHFSKAKGGKPVEKKVRGLAWVVLKWASKKRWAAAGTKQPRVIMLENVEEFTTWGPLVQKENGEHHPCPKSKGKTFKAFIGALKKQGYAVEHRSLRACDYGAPTIRKRLFMVARCDGAPIVWPEPTHGDPKKKGFEESGLKPWRTAAECIDWSLPVPSIFLTKEEAKAWGKAHGVNPPKRPLAEKTKRRIARGIKKYVLNAAEPFIATYYGEKGDEFRGQGLDEALRTQTTENRHALVTPILTEHANASSDRNFKADEPLRTQCAQVKGGHFALVSPLLTPVAHGEESPTGVKRWGKGYRELRKPAHTITGKGTYAYTSATLIQTGYGERKGQAPRVPGLDKPLGTAVAGGTKHAAVTALLKHYGGVVGQGMEKPLGTVTSVDHHSVLAASITRHMGQSVGSSLKEPARTGTAKEKDSLTVATILKNKGTSHGHAADVPLHTICGGGTYLAEVLAFLMKYNGTEQDPKLKDPMHTVTSKDRFGLVTIRGEEYRIVDICMRMLSPRELFRAQGFPESYIIDRGHYPGEFIGGKPITKTAQVAKCGNSVCPDLARVLVEANMVEGAKMKRSVEETVHAEV